MKHLWTIAWTLALALLLVQAGAAQDKSNDGVVGHEVFGTSTPQGGGDLQEQPLVGRRTPWSIVYGAPALTGAANVVVVYYDSKESRDKAREKEKGGVKGANGEKKKNTKASDPRPVPTYDSRFYDYIDGKLVPKTPTYDPRFYEYKDGKLVPKSQPQSDGIEMSLSNPGRLTTNGGEGGNSVQGLVVPDNLHDRQPFSFAVSQHAGQAVNIQTVEGEVVQATSTDRYGRIFLTSGLAAGIYLISSSNHTLGKIEIQQHAGNALQNSQSMRLVNAPETLKLSDPFSLRGNGFSPNFGDMQVSLCSSGMTETPIVLAATEKQLKLAPVQQLQPGPALLKVSNNSTGETIGDNQLLLYDIQGNLVRREIKSHGDKTQLVIEARPENQPLQVKVNVVSGPVDFGDGHKEAEGTTSNGQAVFPVHAEHGSGAFQLAWELTPDRPGAPQIKKDGAASCKSTLHISCIQGYGPSGFCCLDDPTPDGWLACSEMCKNKQ
ncbi:MAG TPA: hypothetical protein VJA94_06545 [Candidatus Angelobacter sp.]